MSEARCASCSGDAAAALVKDLESRLLQMEKHLAAKDDELQELRRMVQSSAQPPLSPAVHVGKDVEPAVAAEQGDTRTVSPPRSRSSEGQLRSSERQTKAASGRTAKHGALAVSDGKVARDDAWRRFCKAARRELTEEELARVDHATLRRLLSLYKFDARPVDSARIELRWQEFQGIDVDAPLPRSAGMSSGIAASVYGSNPRRAQPGWSPRSPSPAATPRRVRATSAARRSRSALSTPATVPSAPDRESEWCATDAASSDRKLPQRGRGRGAMAAVPGELTASEKILRGAETAEPPHLRRGLGECSPRRQPATANVDTVGERAEAVRLPAPNQMALSFASADPNMAGSFYHDARSSSVGVHRGSSPRREVAVADPNHCATKEPPERRLTARGDCAPQPSSTLPRPDAGLRCEVGKDIIGLSPRAGVAGRGCTPVAGSNPNQTASPQVNGITCSSPRRSVTRNLIAPLSKGGRRGVGAASSDPNAVAVGRTEAAWPSPRRAEPESPSRKRWAQTQSPPAARCPVRCDPNTASSSDYIEQHRESKQRDYEAGAAVFQRRSAGSRADPNGVVGTGDPATCSRRAAVRDAHRGVTESPVLGYGSRMKRQANPPGHREGEAAHPMFGCDSTLQLSGGAVARCPGNGSVGKRRTAQDSAPSTPVSSGRRMFAPRDGAVGALVSPLLRTASPPTTA